MNLDIEKIGDVMVVVVPGETLEASSTQQFKEEIEFVLEKNLKVVFDMNHIRFIDSTGCGVLVSSFKRLKGKGGGLKLCCITGSVESIFKLMGFDRLFGIFKTREEAVKAFK